MKPEHEAIVIKARKNAEERAKGYREQALKMYPWVCGRCGREFNHANLRELTVTTTHQTVVIGSCSACIAMIMNTKSC